MARDLLLLVLGSVVLSISITARRVWPGWSRRYTFLAVAVAVLVAAALLTYTSLLVDLVQMYRNPVLPWPRYPYPFV